MISKGKYLGDKGSIEIEVAKGLKIPINVSAEKAFLGEGVRNGTNILTTLQSLVKGLEMNNVEQIRGSIDELQKANEQISQVRGEVGARMNQIQRAVDNHVSSKIDTLDSISKIEEADAIKVFSELARDQTVLKAAISTSQKMLSENPTDILFK